MSNINIEIERQLRNENADIIHFVDISMLDIKQNRGFPFAILIGIAINPHFLEMVCNTPYYTHTIDDAVTYISRYSMQAGNSQLLNERIHDLTLNSSWRWLTLMAFFERTEHPITQWAYLTDGDAALIKHINLGKPIDTYSAYLAATPRVGIWSLNATAGVEKHDFSLDLDDSMAPGGKRHASFCKPVWTLNAFNTFLLKHAWKIDVNFMFRSRGHSLNFYNDYDNLRLGLVVQKSFLRDRSLTCRVAIVDIFQRNRRNEFADMGYYQVQQNNRFSTHKLNLALFYRFNATRSKYKGMGAGKEAQARMGS